ncbi:MAG: TonB-dependent receptor [Pseudomonadota bacterium]
MAYPLRPFALGAVQLGLMMAALSPALAQDMDGIEEIIVTAQHRAQNLQDVPIAVSAFSARQLERRQVTDTIDLVRLVPNMVGNNNTGISTANTYFIRGLGNTEALATFDPPVGTYVDDVYLARQNANNFALFDVERIEVLRGPQGTLFGRNTTGGAVNVILKKPAEELTGFAEASYGRFDEIRTRASLDAPLTSKLLSKFSFFFTDDAGFVANPTTGETLDDVRNWGTRGALRLLPGGRVTWDLAADYIVNQGTNIGDTPGVKFTSLTGLSKREGDGTGPTDFPLLNDNRNGRGLGNETRSLSLTSNLGVVFDDFSVTAITGWRDLEQDFNLDFVNAPVSTGGFAIVNRGKHRQFTQEMRLNAQMWDEGVDLVAGLFYLNEDNATRFADAIPAFVLIDRLLDNRTRSTALYAQADIHLTDTLIFTAGARYTDETKKVAVQSTANGLLQISTDALVAAGIPTRQKARELSPRFAVQYYFSDGVNVFASVTNGFRSGGWNGRATSAIAFQPFGPEEAWSYEAGVRAAALDRRLTLNATGFYLDLNAMQVLSGFTPPGGTTPIFVTQNAADMGGFGFEAELAASLTPALEVFATLGLQNLDYRNIRPDLVGLSGDLQPVRTPKRTATMGGAYSWPIPALAGAIILSANGSYTSAHFVATNNAPAGLAKGRFIVQAAVAYESSDGRWRLAAECVNCTNRNYLEAFLIIPYTSEPARWRIRAQHRF